MKRFKLIVNTLKESGFFISPKLRKEMEGHLELKRRGKEWKKLYVVLFKDYIYMFKPHVKVSVCDPIHCPPLLMLQVDLSAPPFTA